MKIYNGKGMILGRLAAKVAKDALLGEEVKVVNCREIIVSGSKIQTVKNEVAKRKRKGYPLKSAKFSRLPDRFVRRSIRGMLPWKQARGKEAYDKIMCYVNVPEELVGKDHLKVDGAGVEKLPSRKFTTVGEICKSLGGKQ
tara:strand:+ start:35057 stop:35479 length:423 start_codon:yes stop_codon:yes gene_type:complete